jgi:AraC-like DNA-binding protein
MTETTPIKTKSDDPLIKELLKKMRTERLYADHDLRVGSLASLMNIPEYKLRAKINQQLGYRNFNQFVNQYRIEEASEKLLDNARLPVLSIALDVGFRSISSFNTAFQQQFGVSPTKYRSEALTES